MAEIEMGSKRGCIKTTKGPWKVKKITKDGQVVTKLRFPTEGERQKNRQRECLRRSVTKKIFSGLKSHGNYKLPKHADNNDLLRALCEEAGYHVDDDGTVYKKEISNANTHEVVENSTFHNDAGYIRVCPSCVILFK